MAVRQMLVAGRYRLLEPVGAGGMGRVWLARDQMLDRDVAIKEIVPPDWMSDAEKDRLHNRTLREARSAARLTHPHVVRVYDVVHAEGLSWIVMEYVASRSLYQVLLTKGPYPPVEAARIGLAVLDALTAAHRAGVLHRDVKPHNVLIGSDGRVLLTDFGLATFVDDGLVTTPGLIVGSPQYVSPERARDGASTVESDLWSFGATLYAAVEGQSPYARDSAMATLAALATEPPDPPSRAGPLAPVLQALLRYEPKERLTAEQTERQLRRILEDAEPVVPAQRHRPAPANPVSPARPVPAPAARERRAAEHERHGRPAAEPVAPERHSAHAEQGLPGRHRPAITGSTAAERHGPPAGAAAPSPSPASATWPISPGPTVARDSPDRSAPSTDDGDTPNLTEIDRRTSPPADRPRLEAAPGTSPPASDPLLVDTAPVAGGSPRAVPLPPMTDGEPAMPGKDLPGDEGDTEDTAATTNTENKPDTAATTDTGNKADTADAADTGDLQDSGGWWLPSGHWPPGDSRKPDPKTRPPSAVTSGYAANDPEDSGPISEFADRGYIEGTFTTNDDEDQHHASPVSAGRGHYDTDERNTDGSRTPAGPVGDGNRAPADGNRAPGLASTGNRAATGPGPGRNRGSTGSGSSRFRPNRAPAAAGRSFRRGNQAPARVIPAPRQPLSGRLAGDRMPPRWNLRSPVMNRTRTRLVIAGLLLVAMVGGTLLGVHLIRLSDSAPGVVHVPAVSPSTSRASPVTPAAPRPGGFSPIVCDAPPPAGVPVAPKDGAARGVNGWTLQAGWSYFTDGTGFHLPVPDGWTYQRLGSTYCFRDPRTARVLSLDVGREPRTDPLKGCRAEDRRLRLSGRVRDYALIAIGPVTLLHKAADWEYRYRGDTGILRRATTRWFTAGGRPYALGWSTPDAVWAAEFSKVQMVRSTFYADTHTPSNAARRS
ncbi:protein kinase [Actinoplanes oblitus]|uniref:non-specific serine/threonine protein kinase n=1 Tax=Actinoplanes oblitus TaxID=3040509 RepID=A0ABY8WC39_9ACTN|nr:serine/threonine-protein kinase [Actinoplanes oblitus]WIM95365.1 protein kinase [Actinoplanes oblitus]